MARRARNLALQVEYKDTDNKIRAQSLGLMVEHVDTNNMRRLQAIAVMMEYTGTPVIAPTSVPGPKLQMMNG